MITLKSTFRGDQFLFAPAEEVDIYLSQKSEGPYNYRLHPAEPDTVDIEDTTLEALQTGDISDIDRERGFALDIRDRLRSDL